MQDTKTPWLWDMTRCTVTKPGWAKSRGLSVGLVDVDAVRLFGTGAFVVTAYMDGDG